MKRNIGSDHMSRFLKSAFLPSQKIAVVHGWGWEGSGKRDLLLCLIPTNREERKASDSVQMVLESCESCTSESIIIICREIKWEKKSTPPCSGILVIW